MGERKQVVRDALEICNSSISDSAPDNWQQILEEKFIPAFISPLHDSDVNPTGEPKSPIITF